MSSSLLLAVSMMMGMSAVTGSRLSRRVRSSPLTPGIIQSIRMMSGLRSLMIDKASRASPAISTSMPARRKENWIISRIANSSSTTRTRAGLLFTALPMFRSWAKGSLMPTIIGAHVTIS